MMPAGQQAVSPTCLLSQLIAWHSRIAKQPQTTTSPATLATSKDEPLSLPHSFRSRLRILKSKNWQQKLLQPLTKKKS
jgi:hypothetical protein